MLLLFFFCHSWDNLYMDYFYHDSARLDFLFQTDIFLINESGKYICKERISDSNNRKYILFCIYEYSFIYTAILQRD